MRRRVSFRGRALRVGILIDGSNFIASLYRAKVGYPALGVLFDLLRGTDEVTLGRFYGAPPMREPWAGRWKSFVSANRHLARLEFFQGYRHKSTDEEKVIDVALATDLLYGHSANMFDRAVVVGGDGDHIYALKAARKFLPIRVFLLDPHTRGLAAARIPYTLLNAADLVRYGICDPGEGAPVPAAHRAPVGSASVSRIQHGSNALLPGE